MRQGVNPSQGAGQRPVPSPQHPFPCHTRALSTAIARPFLLSFRGPARNLGLVHSRPSSSSFSPSPAGAGLVPALPFRHSAPRAGIQKRGAAHPEHRRRVKRGAGGPALLIRRAPPHPPMSSRGPSLKVHQGARDLGLSLSHPSSPSSPPPFPRRGGECRSP